jgi:putative hydrolases of HD superfamily
MNSIKEMLGSNPFGQEAVDLWKEYASDSTPDANFVKDLDKLELIIQAVEYEKSNKCGI